SLSTARARPLPHRARDRRRGRAHAPTRRRVLRARDRDHVSVVALSALYALLLWLVSSMLRGKGILLVAAGAAALAAALVAAARGRRQPFYRLLFLTALLAAGTLGAEGLLWLAPGLLKGRLANQVL